ncbi:MAG TPA: ROK family protein [Candidatus Acidoferrum sp.]|nr:ROK family protein [Candidatus Acidoferrum sp.]
MTTYGGLEAGGTKFVCAIGTGPDDLERADFPTTTPDETIGRALAFFRDRAPVHALGIASFGPVDLDPRSATYGYITSTPKPGWSHTDIAGLMGRALGVPVHLDTDVNAAALAESRWGSARGLDDVVYLTVGTGIGGGALVGGRLVHGLLHPEMGHMRLPHDRIADPYGGICPFHGDCLEGLASGPAIEQRWGVSAQSLPSDHPAWRLEARYLAAGVVNLVCTLSPRRVIMGGGVMEQAHLFPMIREEVAALLNGYVAAPEIGPPALGKNAGVLGAIALAR